jgi:amidase
MPVQPPTLDQLTTIANRLDLRMNEDELAAATELAKPMVAVYGRLDELPDERLPVRYPRSSVGYRPVGDENPCNGWAWRCSIPGAERGPLAGRTVGVKDNICVAGIPMLNGSSVMEGYVPSEDATVVTRLLDAGAHIVGKTAVPGLCVDAGGITGYPEPQPLNPWDERHLPGASSSGSAVVVVTGQADLAVGGDQAGSIRLPASWSGCCGHKPTYGLVPYTGIFPLELTIDHVGPMARTVADCALMLEVMAGADGLDPRQIDVRTQPYAAALDQGAEGLRVGVLREGFGMPHVSEADVDDAVLAAAEVLAQAGASVEDVSVPMHDDSLAVWSAITTEGLVDMGTHGEGLGLNHKGHYSTDLMDFYSRARRARAHDLPKVVKLVLLVGSYVSESTHHHYYAKGQSRPAPLRRLRRGARACRRPSPADHAHEGVAGPGRALARGGRGQRDRQHPQHRRIRRHRSPGLECPVRSLGRKAGRRDARWATIRRRNRPPCWPRLRAGAGRARSPLRRRRPLHEHG